VFSSCVLCAVCCPSRRIKIYIGVKRLLQQTASVECAGRVRVCAGISDYDHTRPSRHDRSSRSRSGDREKSQTPESSGRPRAVLASGRRTPATPAGGSTGKKAGAGSKGKSHLCAGCMRKCSSCRKVFFEKIQNLWLEMPHFQGMCGQKLKL